MTSSGRRRPGSVVAGMAAALVVLVCCAAPALVGASLLAVVAALWRPWLGCIMAGVLPIAWIARAEWRRRRRCPHDSAGVD